MYKNLFKQTIKYISLHYYETKCNYKYCDSFLMKIKFEFFMLGKERSQKVASKVPFDQ